MGSVCAILSDNIGLKGKLVTLIRTFLGYL